MFPSNIITLNGTVWFNTDVLGFILFKINLSHLYKVEDKLSPFLCATSNTTMECSTVCRLDEFNKTDILWRNVKKLGIIEHIVKDNRIILQKDFTWSLNLGFHCTVNFYHEILKLVIFIFHKNMKRIKKILRYSQKSQKQKTMSKDDFLLFISIHIWGLKLSRW